MKLPDLNTWRSLDHADCIDIAKYVVSAVPINLELHAVELHEYEGTSQFVAFFKHENRTLAFVPGAKPRLGFEWTRPFQLTEIEKES